MINGSIHGLKEYIEFEYNVNIWILLPTAPLFYILPTTVIMWKIFKGYNSTKINCAKITMDGHLFALLMLYFLANLAFFFADMLRFNIPASGLVTSWCAQLEPNRFFTLLIMTSQYLNYTIVILPFPVSLLRFLFHRKFSMQRIVMKWLIGPVLILVPLTCVCFLLPSIGYCRQLGAPFPFGAVSLSYTLGFFGARNSYFILALSFTCCTFSAISSGTMYFLLRTRQRTTASTRTRKLTRKAEISISVTMISAIIPLITNTFAAVSAIWIPSHMFYCFLVRVVGNDVETVMMPWILYVTHPIFQEKEAKRPFRVTPINRDKVTD